MLDSILESIDLLNLNESEEAEIELKNNIREKFVELTMPKEYEIVT